MSELTISADTQVTLHFAISLKGGHEVDSTFNKTPATFVVGDGNLLPGFEQALFGLKSGDEASLDIAPHQGFGQPNPDNVQRMSRATFDEDLSPGLMLSFADANGSELPGVVDRIDGDDVYVDFNHPLAGRDLVFKVAILAVNPAPNAVQ
ncbi:peptidylprolyl isomerase [Litorivicinus lipolyticus]|uniref:Peptidyl-prolyl cis-trans isomerase n=1 Tax=Litorivicinus lipolyticus TaxID=418701 RepID=A0A5Q2QEV3_9GAMM|nr:peptidylprolyl isomerase [Litorivicinus lipolyticus]QGG80901.1 peptidylprolyl isomerase [Litorivicinus lipolyticus]